MRQKTRPGVTRPVVRKRPPTRPGWYWTRLDPKAKWVVVTAVVDAAGQLRITGPGYFNWPVSACGSAQQWAVPLRPPARAAH